MSQSKLLAYLIAFISLLALISFSFSPYFEIRKIQFDGLNVLNKDEFSFIINSYKSENILFLDDRKLESKLLEMPFVKSVAIDKSYPDTLQINIIEREPVAKINNNGKYLSFTSDGIIVEIGPVKTKVAVPEIKGLGYSFNNKYISFSPILEEIVQALSKVSLKTRADIISIVYTDVDTLIANLNNLPVYLGRPTDLVEKFKILESIINKIEEEDLLVSYIDLTLLKKPVIKLE